MTDKKIRKIMFFKILINLIKISEIAQFFDDKKKVIFKKI